MLQYRTSEGDTVDYIAWKHYGTQAGQVVERLADANPGLADFGPVLPANVIIDLPEFESKGVTDGVRLWD